MTFLAGCVRGLRTDSAPAIAAGVACAGWCWGLQYILQTRRRCNCGHGQRTPDFGVGEGESTQAMRALSAEEEDAATLEDDCMMTHFVLVFRRFCCSGRVSESRTLPGTSSMPSYLVSLDAAGGRRNFGAPARKCDLLFGCRPASASCLAPSCFPSQAAERTRGAWAA